MSSSRSSSRNHSHAQQGALNIGEIGMVFLMWDDRRTIALWNGVEAVRIENPLYRLAQDLARCTAPYDIDDRLPEFVRKLVAIDDLFWTDIALSL